MLEFEEEHSRWREQQGKGSEAGMHLLCFRKGKKKARRWNLVREGQMVDGVIEDWCKACINCIGGF